MYKFTVVNRSNIPASAEIIEAETSLEAAEKAFPEYEVVAARDGLPSDFSVGRVVRTKYSRAYHEYKYKIGAEKKPK